MALKIKMIKYTYTQFKYEKIINDIKKFMARAKIS